MGVVWCVVLAIPAAIGCAGSGATKPHDAAGPASARPRSVPTSSFELPVPHPPSGPPCAPGGPTAELKALEGYPGKPPHRNETVDAHVRNPLASPVWLLYDLGGGLPSIINAVTLARTSPAPGTHVWSFAGDGGFEAVRLRPGADLVLRALEVDTFSTEDPFVLAFATSITIGDRPPESWAGQAGLSAASGDFAVSRQVTEFERKVDSTDAAPLAVRIMCVQRFGADEPVTP